MKLSVNQALLKAQQLVAVGKQSEAEPILAAVLQVDPKNKRAKALLASAVKARDLTVEEREGLMAAFHGGQFERAIEIARGLQAQCPKPVLPSTIMGASYAQLGQPEQAVQAFRKSVALNPKFFQGFNNLGNALKETGALKEAREAYLKAITLNPNFAQGFNNLGVVLKDMKRYQASEKRLRQAVALDPNYSEALRNLGVLYQEQKHHAKAIASFRACLKIAPNDLEGLSNLAGSYKASEQFTKAIETFDKVLKINPNRVDDRQALGLALTEIGDYARAISELRQVVNAQPQNIVSLIHLGNALSKTDDLDAAMDVFQQVLRIAPNNQGALNNIGVIQQNKGDLDAAAKTFDAALAVDPTVSELRMNRGVVHFLKCEFAQAWTLYESRFEHENPATSFLQSSKPVWQGQNQRVFVWAEQGLGDEVFFASVLAQASEMASALIVSVDPRLMSLFQRSFPNIQFVDRSSKVNEDSYDAHIPIGHLAAMLRQDVDAFAKQPKGYLVADTSRINELKQSVGSHSGKTIGIAWHTQNRKSGHVRNIDLDMMVRALGGADVRFVNLQYGKTEAEIAAVAKSTGTKVITVDQVDRFNDIEGLCALIQACDHVVTIDNSTVHLAAAMGVDTHLIVPFFPDWRWPQVESGSLWYPGLNIYRQDARFGWPAVLDRISQHLNAPNPRK